MTELNLFAIAHSRNLQESQQWNNASSMSLH